MVGGNLWVYIYCIYFLNYSLLYFYKLICYLKEDDVIFWKFISIVVYYLIM